MTHAYDEVNFATTVTGVATIQAWPGTVSANAADRVARVKGITYSGAAAGTVTLYTTGPFGTVYIDTVVTGTSPFSRGYAGNDVFVIGAAQTLIATVTGTVSIAGIVEFEVGRQ